MVTSLLKITQFTIISKSKYFKFILDYESSAFTRSIYKIYCRFEIRRTLRTAKDERHLLRFFLTTVHHCLFLRPHHSWIHGEILLDLKPENEGGNLFSSDAAING